MASLEYLEERLRLLYAQAALTGERVAEKYLLVVAETEQAARLSVAEARLIALHIALRYAFVADEPIVMIPPRRAVVLTATDEPQLSESLARLLGEFKLAAAEGDLPSTRCWNQPLPRDPVELSLVLLEMDG